MKKKINKKINYFRIVLFILLIISLLLYLKFYVFIDNQNINVDLPTNVTNKVWYEFGTLNELSFTSGNFEYSNEENDLSSCSKYYYNNETSMINFNCRNYSMKLVSVSEYKMILVINNKDVITYYSSLDLVKYLMDNNINNISDEDIEEIIKDNDFKISKVENSNVYKSIQLSKLSSINELSVDEYIDLKNKSSKSIVFLINPNMGIDSYDLIPIFISWKDKYKDYDFFYINGSNLSINDYYILDKDKVLKDYLIGLYDSNILIFNSGDYKRISIDILSDNTSEDVFDCNSFCDKVELKIYDNENNYESLEEVLGK